jgi:hypothetical protein
MSRAAPRVRHILQPPVGLLRLGQRRLDLCKAGFQQGVFPGENSGIHGPK